MTGRLAELAALTAAGAIPIDREAFQRKHPYVLSDGRRFCSLELAADTAFSMPRNTTVTYEPTGHVFCWSDCAGVSTRDLQLKVTRAVPAA